MKNTRSIEKQIVVLPMLFAALLLAPGSGPEGSAPAAPGAEQAPPSRLTEMFTHAKRHETAEVLRFKGEVDRSGDRAWQIGYWVALYIASPERYERELVDHFPVDAEGIMRVLYDRIELAELTPEFLFSFGELGRIAEKGDAAAIRRVLEGLGNSDGAVAESLCHSLCRLFDKQLPKTLEVLGVFPAEDRERIVSRFPACDPDELRHVQRSLSALDGSSQVERSLIREISEGIRAAEASRRDEPPFDSGIEGITLIGPLRPAFRIGDERPNEAPYPAKLQILNATDGIEVALVETGKDGKFRIGLPPGEYLLRPAQEPGRRYPPAVELTVKVVEGQYTQITVHLDSGLR